MITKEEFFYDSRDNKSKIHAVRWIPESGTPKCIIQIVHGMAEHIERYHEFAMYLAQQGILVTGEDHLGHGQSKGEYSLQGYFCSQDPATVLVRDVHRLKKLTQEKYPMVPYFLVGHSMGSFITRNYLCRYGSGIQGAVIMGTGMKSKGLLVFSKITANIVKLFFGEKHVSHFLDKAAFGSFNKKIMNPRTPKDWLTKDNQKVDDYLKDPNCNFVFTVNGFLTLFELIDRIVNKENLNKIPKELPVYMISGKDDPVGDYGKGVEKAYASLEMAGLTNMELKLYQEDRHELLNETDREKVAEDIYLWIKKQLGEE